MGSEQLAFDYDVVVIGGGAAGLFCASLVGQGGKRTLLLEHNKQFGKKILISGGGRCNFTNLHASPSAFHGENPHFPKSSLSRYSPKDFIQLVEKYGIRYFEKKFGQLFCQNSAKELLALLVEECDKGEVELQKGVDVQTVDKTPNGFVVKSSRGELSARKVVVATGGLPIAKLGASDFGLQLAKKFDLRVENTAPGLVPFLHTQENQHLGELAGISIDVEAKAQRGPCFRENLLFTHKGLSGPAILQVSSYWREGESVSINWLPAGETSIRELQKSSPRKKVLSYFKDLFPAKFVEKLMTPLLKSEQKNFAELSKKEIESLQQFLTNWKYKPASTAGYRKAEVMRGGVSCGELSSKGLEAKRSSGLYFIGEVVDVTGWLGGYNFQWAWASASACAEHILHGTEK